MRRQFDLRKLFPVLLLQYTGVTVSYTVRYQEGSCGNDSIPAIPSINVTIPCGGAALRVMETATDYPDSNVARMYRFTATYFGSTLGYFINAINMIPDPINPPASESCFWLFLIETPDGEILRSNFGVSSFTFNGDGYGMIMRYTALNESQTFGDGTIDGTTGMCSGALASAEAMKFSFISALVLLSISLIALF